MANRKGQCRQYSIDTTLAYSLSDALYFKLTHLKWYNISNNCYQVFVKKGREHGKGGAGLFTRRRANRARKWGALSSQHLVPMM